MTDLFDAGAAEFSDDERYRYMLTRTWDQRPKVAYVLLNPSTTDEAVNDPTVTRCVRRARLGGFGGLVLVNLFAYRATDPSWLPRVTDPVGPDNDAAILRGCRMAQTVVCGWGVDGVYLNRAHQVLALLASNGVQSLQCWRVNADGSPQHPLYLPYSAALVPFTVGASRP